MKIVVHLLFKTVRSTYECTCTYKNCDSKIKFGEFLKEYDRKTTDGTHEKPYAQKLYYTSLFHNWPKYIENDPLEWPGPWISGQEFPEKDENKEITVGTLY